MVPLLLRWRLRRLQPLSGGRHAIAAARKNKTIYVIAARRPAGRRARGNARDIVALDSWGWPQRELVFDSLDRVAGSCSDILDAMAAGLRAASY